MSNESNEYLYKHTNDCVTEFLLLSATWYHVADITWFCKAVYMSPTTCNQETCTVLYTTVKLAVKHILYSISKILLLYHHLTIWYDGFDNTRYFAENLYYNYSTVHTVLQYQSSQCTLVCRYKHVQPLFSSHWSTSTNSQQSGAKCGQPTDQPRPK